MQEGLKYGRLVKVKVDNMRLQNEGVAEKEAKSTNVSTSTSQKDWGLIAIAAGEGLADIFREMGVNHVVSGGQTMNPSTEDILTAIEAVNAEKSNYLTKQQEYLYGCKNLLLKLLKFLLK